MIEISLCMIVRNEENSLPRCLSSAASFADEIVVVDTGSTDRTKEVAASFGAVIYDFTWIEDFSAARNFAFSKAAKDYILWLDADDYLKDKDQELFRGLKTSLPGHVDSVNMPYNLAFDAAGNVVTSLRRNRLVRRSCNFKWIGPVHEHLEVYGPSYSSDVCITHEKDKAYTDRNLRIYQKRAAAGEAFSPGTSTITRMSCGTTGCMRRRAGTIPFFWKGDRAGSRIITRPACGWPNARNGWGTGRKLFRHSAGH